MDKLCFRNNPFNLANSLATVIYYYRNPHWTQAEIARHRLYKNSSGAVLPFRKRCTVLVAQKGSFVRLVTLENIVDETTRANASLRTKHKQREMKFKCGAMHRPEMSFCEKRKRIVVTSTRRNPPSKIRSVMVNWQRWRSPTVNVADGFSLGVVGKISNRIPLRFKAKSCNKLQPPPALSAGGYRQRNYSHARELRSLELFDHFDYEAVSRLLVRSKRSTDRNDRNTAGNPWKSRTRDKGFNRDNIGRKFIVVQESW